jgi:transposase
MKSHEVLREAFKKTSAKQVAEQTGLSLSAVYKWTEPSDGTGSGAPNPLDRVETLLQASGDKRIAQWICERAGGFFVNNPTGERARQVLPAASEIMQEFADMLSMIAQAAVDNVVTKAETEGIRRRWEELKSVSEGFVRSCEQGDFSSAREILSGKKDFHKLEKQTP